MNKTQYLKRNICIGLIDGISIPLSLAAALSNLVNSSGTIVMACIAAAFAGAVTMSYGSYVEGKKYEPAQSTFSSAFTVGISYFIGGLAVAMPYLMSVNPISALIYSCAISFVLLFFAGYVESTLNGSSGWLGAARIILTATIAAGAAYLVSGLF